MTDKLSLNSPIKTLIIKVLTLSGNSAYVLGRTKKEDLFFKDLLSLGCDFFELLEIYANCNQFTTNNIDCILNNVQVFENITNLSDKELRKMIPHWTASKHHTASIEDVCREVKELIEGNSCGAFVYNSNMNTKSKKRYNDIYLLLISMQNIFFFDINRRKSYKILISDGS